MKPVLGMRVMRLPSTSSSVLKNELGKIVYVDEEEFYVCYDNVISGGFYKYDFEGIAGDPSLPFGRHYHSYMRQDIYFDSLFKVINPNLIFETDTNPLFEELI